MEGRALVTEALLAGAQRTEVLGGLRNDLWNVDDRWRNGERKAKRAVCGDERGLRGDGETPKKYGSLQSSLGSAARTHVGAESHLDAAGRGAADGHVEEDNRVGHCGWWCGER